MTPGKVTLSLHTFGQQLRQYRKAHKFTQATLAHQAGCAVSTLRHIERDRLRPSRQLAKQLAHCFNLDPDEQHRFVQAARHVSPSKENTRPVPHHPTHYPGTTHPIDRAYCRTRSDYGSVAPLHRTTTHTDWYGRGRQNTSGTSDCP